MKKLISALAVVFAIAASYSCQREADYITDPAQAVTVTYNVSLDQVQKTKATLAELDNAVAVNKLFYSVYVQSGTGTSATYTAVDHSDYHKVVDLDDNGTAEVTIKLIENDTYKVVFWAQKDDAYLATGNFAKGGLEDITIDYTASDSYASDKDAFTAYDVLEISPVTTDTSNGKSFEKEIHLKRPFAQINFGADDGTQAAALGYTPNKVQVTVKQAATKFNAATGVAGTPIDAVFAEKTLDEVVNFTVNSKDYQRIGKAYVLPAGTFTVDQSTQAITDALAANVEITLDLWLQKSDQSLVKLDSRAKANVPVRSNYRTNLLGSLITTDVTFNVVVDNDYDGSTDYISIVTAGNASGNGAVSLTQPETISSNINFGEHPVTLDETLTIGADVTITGGSSITVNKGIVVAAGNTLTLDDVTINPSSSEATITIEPGASLIINGGTYTADNTQVLFDLLSGSNPAPVAPGAIRPRAHGADGDQLIIRGGSFTGFDPTPYVDTDHYTVTGTGPWTVAAKQVTLTVEAGDVNMKVGDEAVLKTLTVDPADTDLSGISFEYSVANVAAASYSEGKISIAAVGAGSTVITVKVGAASATINVTVLPADSIEVAPASLSLKVGQTSEAVTVTLNNNATVSSVASNNANATVNWTSGNTFTVTGAAIGESTITVTASNGKTATVAVTVSKADAVKLAAPVLSTETADAGETSIVLSWTAVEHASGYAVSYGAESPVNVSTNEVTLSNLALATEYTITVVAKGDGDAYTDSDASNSIKVTTEKGTVSIALVKDEFELIEGTDATVSQAQIQASVKYGTTVVDGAALTYAVKDDDLKGNVTVSSTGLVTAGAGEAAATILVNYAGNATYKAAEATVTVGVSVKTLESITLGTDLVKKTFELNEEFTHANIVVTANYNNNTTADVTSQATFSTPDMATAGDKTVTVSFGGKDATYTIHVNEAVPVTLSSVAITTQASTTTFTEGDVFVATGLVLTGTYSDNSTKTLEPTFEIGGNIVTPGTTTLSGTGEKTVTVYSAEDNTKTASYTITVEAAPIVVPGSGEGTQASPYDVTRALYYIDALNGTVAESEVYVQGYVKTVDEISTQYHNATYDIAVDANATSVIKVYHGKYLDNTNFTAQNQLMVGDVVVVYGKLQDYVKDEVHTPEIASGNYIKSFVSQVERPLEKAVISGVPATMTLAVGETYNFATNASVTPNGASLAYAASGNGTITNAGVLTVNSNATNGDEIVVTVTAPAVDAVCLEADPVTCTVTVGAEESLAGDYVIAAFVSNKYHAMTSTDCGANTKRFASEEITYSGSGSITVTDNDKLWSLEKVSGGYILKAVATNTYFGWDGSSNGAELKAQADALVLTFTENTGSDAGTYAVVPVSNSGKNLAKNSQNAYFGIYNTGQANKIVLIPATYEAPVEYNITYATGLNGGSISGPTKAISGAQVTITANPDSGKKLKAWTVIDTNSQNITVTNNKFTMPAADVTVSAEFEDDSTTPGESTEVTYDFTAIEGFSSWGNSYASGNHDVEYDEAYVNFSAHTKQSSTITDRPVSKAGNVSVVLKDSDKQITEVTFICQQWTTKSQSFKLYYSTDGGSNYTEITSSATTDFTISCGSLPDNTNAVRLSATNTSNQVAYSSVTFTYE